MELETGDLVYFFNLGLGRIIDAREKAIRVENYYGRGNNFWMPKSVIGTFEDHEFGVPPTIPEYETDPNLPLITKFIEIMP